METFFFLVFVLSIFKLHAYVFESMYVRTCVWVQVPLERALQVMPGRAACVHNWCATSAGLHSFSHSKFYAATWKPTVLFCQKTATLQTAAPHLRTCDVRGHGLSTFGSYMKSASPFLALCLGKVQAGGWTNNRRVGTLFSDAYLASAVQAHFIQPN